MNTRTDNIACSIPLGVADQAGSWDARLRSPDCTEADRASFAQWMNASSDHRAAFEDLQTMVATLRHHVSRADVRALRDAALAMAHRLHWRKFFAAAGFAACAVAVIAWISFSEGIRRGALNEYVTAVGQQSTIVLPDGSSVELNARTKIKVAFDQARRYIELLDGQALFRVAKNPQRPFIVRAGDREVLALGTSFDVRLEPRSVKVTLIEGKVAVDRAAQKNSRGETVAKQKPARNAAAPANAVGKVAPSEEVLLAPGQQYVAAIGPQSEAGSSTAPGAGASDGGIAAVVRNIDVDKVTGWRNGRVFLEDLTLAEAVEEMNRHSPVQIVIEDGVLGNLRVNGMFRAGEQDAFAAALAEYFPIGVIRRGDATIVLSARGRQAS